VFWEKLRPLRVVLLKEETQSHLEAILSDFNPAAFEYLRNPGEVSRVFNPGDKVFSGTMKELGKLLSEELGKHDQYLLSVNDSRICCILFHIATPGVEEGVDRLRASQTLAWDLDHPTVGSKTFREHAEDISSRPRLR
jgi:hypothetical protein